MARRGTLLIFSSDSFRRPKKPPSLPTESYLTAKRSRAVIRSSTPSCEDVPCTSPRSIPERTSSIRMALSVFSMQVQ